ncbi:hypothetical protein QGN29_13765 [Temperatibacter marinus]|uniref:Ice-binding protein C-terminal domain-containing protein n=1 Tax=Temperatibacter marinus TaxID=1456591 RepID=A0AA52EHI2_9PROT|nr:PEP-CTERM sorting domain-containing protein [Temperatibacter marinus]WND02614.1 hypothetical protein QGN29_13765 [Temperatibacter marinus]
MSIAKKPISLLLIIGLAISGAYLSFGMYKRSGMPDLEQLSKLPRPSDIVPPPATYVMQVEPDPEIPGIRRLRIIRPSFQAEEADKTSNKAFYLTGTKSAELIRNPTEDSIKPYPEVTLQEAALGALSADEWGFQAVQAYINKSLGDEARTKRRIDDLLSAIESRASQYDSATISDAINLVIEAGARSYWSAFMAPVILDENFKLKDGAIGWDFGPQTKNAYDDFIRVSPNSDMVQGNAMRSLDRRNNGATILNDGIKNMDMFVATGLDDGLYRVVILTGRMPQQEEIQYPFGVSIQQNGAKLNLIDTRATERLAPVMSLATDGPARIEDRENINLEIDSSEQGRRGGGSGQMIVTRAEVQNGTLRIDFRAMGAAGTYVTSVIIYPEQAPEFVEQLTDTIQQILDRIETAAGPSESDQTVLVIDPAESFEDNGSGLPTEESNNAAQGGGDTADLGAAEEDIDTSEDATDGADTETDTETDTGSTDEGVTDIGSQGDQEEEPVTEEPDPTPDPDPTPEPEPEPEPTPDPTINADAGDPYAPVLLGEDFTLDGCGSTFQGVSVCSLTDTDTIELVWLLDGEEIGTGDTLVVLTGEGTLFPTDGSFEVTLEVVYTGQSGDGVTITLDDGTTVFLPGDISLTSTDTAIIQIVAPIPEPGTVGLILSALAMMGYMHIRRRKFKLSPQEIAH